MLTFFVLTMHGLIDHFTAIFLTWGIKCPHFAEAIFCWRYAIDLLHYSKSWIALTSLWYVFFYRDFTMDTILDMTKTFLSSVCFRLFRLFPIDAACDNMFFFFSCQVITLAYRFDKMVPVTAIMDAISLWFSAIYNALLCASGLSPEDKNRRTNYFHPVPCTFIFNCIIWWLRRQVSCCKHICYIS